jgi:hypothetical protein
VRQSPAGSDMTMENEDVVGIHYQAMTDEDTRRIRLVRSPVRELVRAVIICSYEFTQSNQ